MIMFQILFLNEFFAYTHVILTRFNITFVHQTYLLYSTHLLYLYSLIMSLGSLIILFRTNFYVCIRELVYYTQKLQKSKITEDRRLWINNLCAYTPPSLRTLIHYIHTHTYFYMTRIIAIVVRQQNTFYHANRINIRRDLTNTHRTKVLKKNLK